MPIQIILEEFDCKFLQSLPRGIQRLVYCGYRHLQKLTNVGLGITIDIKERRHKAFVFWQCFDCLKYFGQQVVPRYQDQPYGM